MKHCEAYLSKYEIMENLGILFAFIHGTKTTKEAGVRNDRPWLFLS